MKKRVSLFLIAILLFCLCIPTGADVTSTDSLNDHLITHYDFEGKTLGEKYSDKAPAGKSKDAINRYDNSLTTANGIAHIEGATGFSAKFKTTANPDAGEDILNSENSAFTYLTTVRIIGDNLTKGGFSDMFRLSETNAKHLFRFYGYTCNTTAKTMQYCFTSGALSEQKVVALPYESDAFIRIAITMEYSKTAGEWNYRIYLSEDDGQSFRSVLNVSAANSADYYQTATELSFGNRNAQRSNAYDFDDFRIYNKALTADELAFVSQDVTGAVFHGVQSTAVSETGTYGVRFIGSIDGLDYSRVGFRVTAEDGEKVWDIPSSTVYDTLLGSTEDGIVSYSAAALRGEGCYLFALTVRNIPARTDAGEDRAVTFTVTPYTVSSDGVRTEGRTYSVVFSAGVYQPA